MVKNQNQKALNLTRALRLGMEQNRDPSKVFSSLLSLYKLYRQGVLVYNVYRDLEEEFRSYLAYYNHLFSTDYNFFYHFFNKLQE